MRVFPEEFVTVQESVTGSPFAILPPGEAVSVHAGGRRIFDELFQRTILDPYAGTLVGQTIAALSVLTYSGQIPPGHARLTLVDPVFTRMRVSFPR